MRTVLIIFALLLWLFSTFQAAAQIPETRRDSIAESVSIVGDTVTPASPALKKTEDSIRRLHIPRKATIRSAILPGWGQAYNKKYWKIPIVYAALGVTAGIFIFNLNNYRDTRFAYRVKYNMTQGLDSNLYFSIKEELRPLSLESLRFYRDQFRRDIDYSVLFFLLAWGLNVVDATVDAHLKGFDVSPDLSLKLKPGHSTMANTTGLSLVMTIR